ncbi:hypothetical protein MNBD_GAMMA26-1794 [hydrothermal vent metagenome]|uniref:Uncharacterized protein n=1 Tax=hydrothermal vent metagenome TaxID=652676 RepID=A0A3B1B9K8_9ZZZZ
MAALKTELRGCVPLLALVLIAGVSCLSSSLAVAEGARGGTSEQELLDNPEQIISLLTDGAIAFEAVPNPHWRADACRACHIDEEMKRGKMAPLRNDKINALCGSCHDPSLVAEYIHAVDMGPPDEFLDRMPEEFLAALERGQGVVTCIMCHDLPLQCTEARFPQQELNPLFFRGGPYSSRTDLCFNCHDPENYERYNPHDQITDEGELDTEQCFFCHNVTPNRAAVRSIDDVSFNVVGDLKRLCTGCHPYEPHPGGSWYGATGNKARGEPNHLKVPPEKILKQLKTMEAKGGTIMPLEPGTGSIFCATCHNPHEKGVQFIKRADVGADGYKRLRQGQFAICLACHEM